jgi:ssDNA-binding Zn-finger/Zn-ribbon topoisomerase 1
MARYEGYGCPKCEVGKVKYAGNINGLEVYVCQNIQCRTTWEEKQEAYDKRTSKTLHPGI